MTDNLTLEDVLEIAEGVVGEVAVRDIGLLESACHRPGATAFGADAYPTLCEKAAALLHSLAPNHPLTEGNTRLAWAGARVFLLLNSCDVGYASVDEVEGFVLAVARGELEVPEIAAWIEHHLTLDESGQQ